MKSKRKVVLVVDDNEALLEALDTLLSDEYEVIPASDAYQARKILSMVEPAIIFLDCFMPGYNGLQLLREIRQMGLSSQVVIITAAEPSLLGNEIQILGVDGFLQKPFDVQKIAEYAAAA
jgi:two-component system response regulator (stage 0 sporulation protein F)